MNTAELKKLAEAAIYSDTEALPHALTVFRNAANPAAILKLLAINAELADALKKARDELGGLPKSLGYEFDHIPAIDEALAKYEGGEL